MLDFRSGFTQKVVPVADPYRNITDVPEAILESLAEALEAKAKENERCGIQRKVVKEALQGLCGGSSKGAVVVDVGCGTGIVTHALAKTPGVFGVIGVDPCPFFLDKAREKVADDESLEGKLEFYEGSSTNLPLADKSADLVIFMQVLTHLPPIQVKTSLMEANRVLRDGGRVVLLDNDLASWSLTHGPTDILTAPVEAMLGAWHEGKYLCRQFPSLLQGAGFVPQPLTIHSVLNSEEDTYGFNYILIRAIRIYERSGRCSPELAEIMMEEARQRVRNKTFQCLMSYGMCVGYKRSRDYDVANGFEDDDGREQQHYAG